MGFRVGAYAKVFGVQPKSDTNTQLRIAISHKDKNSGEYVQDFSGFVACVGTAAAKKAANLKEGDRIRLGDVDVTTTYNKEKNITYTNYKMFTFETESEMNSGNAGSSAGKTEVDNGEVEPVEEEASDLPF